MDTFVQQLINGLNVGAIYALIALGYTMVYGILRLINFAHGDVYMVGAFAGFYRALRRVRCRCVDGYVDRRAVGCDDHRGGGGNDHRAIRLPAGA